MRAVHAQLGAKTEAACAAALRHVVRPLRGGNEATTPITIKDPEEKRLSVGVSEEPNPAEVSWIFVQIRESDCGLDPSLRLRSNRDKSISVE